MCTARVHYFLRFCGAVLDQLISISSCLVPGPAFCPGAGAAERPQEILYFINLYFVDTYAILFVTELKKFFCGKAVLTKP